MTRRLALVLAVSAGPLALTAPTAGNAPRPVYTVTAGVEDHVRHPHPVDPYPGLLPPPSISRIDDAWPWIPLVRRGPR